MISGAFLFPSPRVPMLIPSGPRGPVSPSTGGTSVVWVFVSALLVVDRHHQGFNSRARSSAQNGGEEWWCMWK